MDIIIPSAILAIISSLVIELVKFSFFKALSVDQQKVLSFLVIFSAVAIFLISSGISYGFQEVVGLFFGTLTISYGVWKTIFSPIERFAARLKN